MYVWPALFSEVSSSSLSNKDIDVLDIFITRDYA